MRRFFQVIEKLDQQLTINEVVQRVGITFASASVYQKIFLPCRTTKEKSLPLSSDSLLSGTQLK